MNIEDKDKIYQTQAVFLQNIPQMNEIQNFLGDLKNLSYHNLIINKALKLAKKLSQIDAVFLLGSLASNTADIFSDIDFYIMINQKKHLLKIKNHFLINLNKIGEPIHIFQSNAYPNSSIIYFKPFIKFELMIEDYTKLIDNWRVGEVSKLLYDPKGLGKKAVNAASKLQFTIDKYDLEIKNVAIELPSFCYNIAGYMLRGEYITSLDFIAWIRRLLLRICGFFLDMWDEGTRRAELRYPKEILDYYYRCQTSKIDGIWQCLYNILDWYSTWLVPKFDLHGIPHANEEIPIIKSILLQSESIYNRKT
jgi:predicted nucleotidyltransferase